MIKFKLYRRIKCVIGGRSFVKTNNKGQKTYVVISYGNHSRVTELINDLKGMGYEEEWPKG